MVSIAKKRLSPEESRSVALEAARQILIEMGPQAVTLKAVASRIDRTHANLLHHFGSAAGLQKALAAYLAESHGKHGRITYDLAGDFGVDIAVQRRRFAFYTDRFAIPPEVSA